jgi:hypothetical protein
LFAHHTHTLSFLSRVRASAIPFFLHIGERLTLAMFSTEYRQVIGHGVATFMNEHPFALVVDFERCTTPTVKDGIVTERAHHPEMTQARDFAQGMSFFAVAWHGLSDEQAVRVAVINGKSDTIIDVIALLLTHGTHTFLCKLANKKAQIVLLRSVLANGLTAASAHEYYSTLERASLSASLSWQWTHHLDSILSVPSTGQMPLQLLYT